MKSADAIVARVLGAACLLLAGMEMLLRHANQYAAAHGGHDLQGLWRLASFLALYGLCLIVYRAWSRLSLLVLGAFSLVFGLERLLTAPRYGLAVDAVVLPVVSLPLIVAILCWRFRNS